MEEITVRNEIENESKAEIATAAHAVSESNEETKENDSGKPSKMKKIILWIFSHSGNTDSCRSHSAVCNTLRQDCHCRERGAGGTQSL